MNITEKDIETYRRDGVVKLSGVFDPKWVDYMREATEECMNNPGKWPKSMPTPKNQHVFLVINFYGHITINSKSL